jgi:CxxC motif-containing protein
MEVRQEDGDFVFPEGICRRGQDYARQEIENPCRVLTTTVPVVGGEIAMLPVRTREPIPKGLLMKVMAIVATLRVEAPVSAGDTVCRSIAGSGVDLVASRSVDRRTR